MSSVGDPRAKQRIITAALALLLLVCFGGPVFETIDHWDNYAETGNDFVLAVMAVAVSAFSLHRP